MEFDIHLYENALKKLYGFSQGVLEYQLNRYGKIVEKYHLHFGKSDIRLFTSPGRTEIGGNHTDHNHGRVLAASVNLDSIAIAAKNNANKIIIYSQGYPAPFYVDLENLNIIEEERGTTSALIRGIAARCKEVGYHVAGFNACVTSDVLPGSGLSSSASIEVLIGTIINHLFNDGKITPESIAIIGQYAENVYFGKPCGLMDQMACAVGGIIAIDFADPQKPVIKKVQFNFTSQRYRLLVVNTGGNHADLTDDYASVPQEMKTVAQALGVDVCRKIEWTNFLNKIKELRSKVGDRALLRVIHFLGDNERVAKQVDALEQGDFKKFLQLVNASGDSSFKWLQNVYSVKNIREQGIALALALTENYLQYVGEGACRVHGGGFAGTIQVFLPVDSVPGYIQLMEPVFGQGSVFVLDIRQSGALQLEKDSQGL